jgi:hypothetical protein
VRDLVKQIMQELAEGRIERRDLLAAVRTVLALKRRSAVGARSWSINDRSRHVGVAGS